MLRAHLALRQYDRVIRESSGEDKAPGLKAIGLHAKYLSSRDDPSAREVVLQSIKSMLDDPETTSASVQLTAAHIYLEAGKLREALQCVHLGTTMEHLSCSLQIYLKIDRMDLAQQQLRLLKQADEEAVLTHLCSIFVDVTTGRSAAKDAIHLLNSLQEQYGPSIFLLNTIAVANMVDGNYQAAEHALKAAISDFGAGNDVDTLVNSVVCYQHMGKGMDAIEPLLTQLRSGFPEHPFVQGLLRVEGAFEREAQKYVVGTTSA